MKDWRSTILPGDPGPRTYLDGAVLGCRWCGIAEEQHPREVHGLGHAHPSVPLGFVSPGDELVQQRQEARMTNGLPIADFNESTGRAKTHLVRATCRCGADAVCTPEQADGARCGSCAQADAEAAVSAPGYDMRETR